MITLIIFSVSFTVGYLMFPFPVILQVLVKGDSKLKFYYNFKS